ncbi:MAG: tripartite tricarboxylate transporter TctB family protein [Gammaproteobacteria bacterium]|nr:tripartite tricarboxylate transporter TctB family protein [Gammaproteobacteria bacterium]
MTLNKERIGALFFLVLSIAYGYFGSEIKLHPGDEYEAMTARTVPYFLALLGIGLSFFLLVTGKSHDEAETSEQREWKPVALLIGLTLVYGLSLDWLGFLLSTILFLLGGFYILGERRWMVNLSVSIIFVSIFWYSLTQLLEIYLAPGRLFAGLFG